MTDIKAKDDPGQFWQTKGTDRIKQSGSLKIPEKAARIIEQYKYLKVSKDDLISPDLIEIRLAKVLPLGSI